jgi:hypothetical protein
MHESNVLNKAATWAAQDDAGKDDADIDRYEL